MSWNKRVVGCVCLCLAAAISVPSVASAQRGRGHGSAPRVLRPVVVAGGFYSPYDNPFFWDFYGWGQPLPPYPGFYGAPYMGGSSARIQVTPRNTEVYVDGYFAGIVDDFDGFSQRLRVPPGEHVIELYLDGFKPIGQSILFQPGETYRIRHAMEPLASGEAAPVRPTPRIPVEIAATPPSPGLDAFGRPKQLEPRAPAADASVQTAGTFSIRVQPSDAAVLIDGERWEGSSSAAPLRVQLTPGAHRVEVQKEGYQTFSTTIEVRPAEATPLNVSLTPRP